MDIRHFPGNFSHGLILFDVEKIAISQNIADSGHIHPSRKAGTQNTTTDVQLTADNKTVAEGLRFACQPGCTACCRQRGFVYLSESDLRRASVYLGMEPADFERRFVYRTRHRMR